MKSIMYISAFDAPFIINPGAAIMSVRNHPSMCNTSKVGGALSASHSTKVNIPTPNKNSKAPAKKGTVSIAINGTATTVIGINRSKLANIIMNHLIVPATVLVQSFKFFKCSFPVIIILIDVKYCLLYGSLDYTNMKIYGQLQSESELNLISNTNEL